MKYRFVITCATIILACLTACAALPSETTGGSPVLAETADVEATFTLEASLPESTATPQATHTPTPIPSVTPIPTPPGGGSLVVAYLEQGEGRTTIHIMNGQQRYEIPLEAQFEGLSAASIAIAPDGSLVAAEIQRNDQTDIVAVPINTDDPQPVVLFTLPENAVLDKLQFSVNGKWLLYDYFLNSQVLSSGAILLESGKHLPLVECKGVFGVGTMDDVVYCYHSGYIDDLVQINLATLNVTPFMELPGNKLFAATHSNWLAWAVLPQQDAFILRDVDQHRYLYADELSRRGGLAYWSTEEIDALLAEPLVLDLGAEGMQQMAYHFLLSPDGSAMAVSGKSTKSLGIGPCIYEDAYTVIVPLEQEAYAPTIVDEFGAPFYALTWSPGSSVVAGITNSGGQGCRLSLFDVETGDEVYVVTDGLSGVSAYFNFHQRGLAAVWLP
jgi:hypothetical protein